MHNLPVIKHFRMPGRLYCIGNALPGLTTNKQNNEIGFLS